MSRYAIYLSGSCYEEAEEGAEQTNDGRQPDR